MQADAGGSPALVARGLSSAQATSGSEQIQIQVPNEKVIIMILLYHVENMFLFMDDVLTYPPTLCHKSFLYRLD